MRWKGVSRDPVCNHAFPFYRQIQASYSNVGYIPAYHLDMIEPKVQKKTERFCGHQIMQIISRKEPEARNVR